MSARSQSPNEKSADVIVLITILDEMEHEFPYLHVRPWRGYAVKHRAQESNGGRGFRGAWREPWAGAAVRRWYISGAAKVKLNPNPAPTAGVAPGFRYLLNVAVTMRSAFTLQRDQLLRLSVMSSQCTLEPPWRSITLLDY